MQGRGVRLRSAVLHQLVRVGEGAQHVGQLGRLLRVRPDLQGAARAVFTGPCMQRPMLPGDWLATSCARRKDAEAVYGLMRWRNGQRAAHLGQHGAEERPVGVQEAAAYHLHRLGCLGHNCSGCTTEIPFQKDLKAGHAQIPFCWLTRHGIMLSPGHLEIGGVAPAPAWAAGM